MRLKRCVGELRILNRQHKFLCLFRIRIRNAERTRAERKRMDTKDDAGDDAECPQSPGNELGKIVAGDVFDHFAAAARERAIRECNGRADDQIAKSAKTQTEDAAVAGGENADEAGLFRPHRINRNPMASYSQLLLQSLAQAASFVTID